MNVNCSFLEANDRYEAESSIAAINEQLGQDWAVDTQFIVRKYIDNGLNHVVFDLMRVGESVAGYAIARSFNNSNEAAYLSYIVIRKENHGQGYGSLLLKNTIEKIEQLKFKCLIFECEDTQVPFYEKFATRNNIPYEKCVVGNYRFGGIKVRLIYDLKPKHS